MPDAQPTTDEEQLADILNGYNSEYAYRDMPKAIAALKRWRQESVLAMLPEELVQDNINPQALTPYENGWNAYRRSATAALTKEEK